MSRQKLENHLNEEKGISVNPDSINIGAEDSIEYRINKAMGFKFSSFI